MCPKDELEQIKGLDLITKLNSNFICHHFYQFFPYTGIGLLYEIATYEDKCPEIEDVIASRKRKYFKRHKSEEEDCAVIVSGTQLTEIDDLRVWENCDDNLKIVILYMNHLTKLPEKLSDFKETITLICIQNNKFQEIPEILYELDKLKHLNMHGNYLSRIPADITKLRNLARLYLGDNDLTSLPDIFGQFQNLQKASFEKNDLTRLPPSFGKLRKLETLDLSENNIVIFPQVLFDLQLRILNVERNRIQIIIEAESDEEKAILFFRNLSHLQMRNNPFIVEKQLDSKKGSLIALQNDNLKLSRSLRVNVLGNSGAGKSSLVQALTFQKYVVPTTKTEHRHTVGIERHFLPLDINGKRVVLHIWDYAGDDEYAMMNNLFITDGSLVWLVVSLANYKRIDDSDNDENVFYTNVGNWLMLIMSHNKNPNVWIICTHSDTCNDALADEKIQRMKYFVKKLCQGKEKKSIALLKNVKYIKLTNTFSFTGIKEMKEELKNLFDPTLHLETPLTVQWINWIDHIQREAELKLSTSESPVFSIEDLTGQLKVTSLSDLQTFLDYYHDVGEIYKIEKLVIHSPKWLISLLKLVYHHDFDQYLDGVKNQCEFRSIHPNNIILDAPNQRIKSGKISVPVLKALWKCHEKEELFEKIMTLFEEFKLTVSSSDVQYYNHPISFYYFPYCLKKRLSMETSKFNDKITSSKSIIVLKCVLPRITISLFLQRLALKLSKDKHSHIYDDGFETMIEKDISLLVLKVTRNHFHDIRIQFSSDKQIDFDLLWRVVSTQLKGIYDFLLNNYSTISSDKAILEVGLRCLCNVYFPLMEITEDVYEEICPKHELKCSKCDVITPINCAVAKNTLNILKTFGHDNSPLLCSETEFNDSFSGTENIKLVTKTKKWDPEEDTLSSYFEKVSLSSKEGDSVSFLSPIEAQGDKIEDSDSQCH